LTVTIITVYVSSENSSKEQCKIIRCFVYETGTVTDLMGFSKEDCRRRRWSEVVGSSKKMICFRSDLLSFVRIQAVGMKV